MNVGDLIRHRDDHEVGLIIEAIKNKIHKERDCALVWWASDCSSWYPLHCLEVINEDR